MDLGLRNMESKSLVYTVMHCLVRCCYVTLAVYMCIKVGKLL